METALTTAGGDSLYLYGFIRVPAEGLAGQRDFTLLEIDDVGCLLRRVRTDDYVRPVELTNADAQIEWLAPRAAHHHDVLQRVQSATAVVPLKFGTLCADLDHVRDVTGALLDQIRFLLSRFHEHDEWTVQACADTAALTQRVVAEEGELRALQQESEHASTGLGYFLRRRLQQLTAALVSERIGSIEGQLVELLALSSVEICGVERPDPLIAARRACVMKCPALVHRHRFTEFEELLRAFEASHTDLGLGFEIVGPWPPYSFATMLDVAAARMH